MSRTDTWMPLHIGDYLSDTMRLTTLQHGAYMLLLMEYWRQGPLVADMDELAAIAKLTRRVWDKEVWPTLSRYFDKQEDGQLHQKRADRERQKAVEISDKRRAAVSQRGDRQPSNAGSNEPQSGNNEPTNVDTNEHTRALSRDLNLSSLRSENQEGDSSLRSLSPRSRGESPRQRSMGEEARNLDVKFEQFWSAYPRRVGKAAARKCWFSAIRRVSPETILAAVREAKWNADVRFVPHPATWLSQDRWDDDPQAEPPTNQQFQRFESTGDRLRRELGLTEPAESDFPTIDHHWGTA